MVTDWSALLVSRDFSGGATVGATAALVVTLATFVGLLLQSGPCGVAVSMGFIGFALGPLFPLLITEAGRRSHAGVAIATARISAVGYGAYLAGPPLVGFLADHTGHLSAFATVACTYSIVLASSATNVRTLVR